MIGYVYLTINDVNNICYVGKRQKPRFDKHYRGSGTHFKLALEKYGKEKFHTYILEWCDSKGTLCIAEKKWVSRFNDMGAELYNIAPGGDGGNMIDWGALGQERRDEINEKNRQSHLGEKNPFYGRHHSEKTKAILREKNKHRRCPEELKAYKQMQRDKLPQVAQIDKVTGTIIKVWDNWCDASKSVSPNNRCGYSHIAECCRNERRSAYGFSWKIIEGGRL